MYMAHNVFWLVVFMVAVVVMLFFSMASNKIHARMCHIFKKPPAYLSALRLHLTLIINVHKVEKVSLSTFGFSAIRISAYNDDDNDESIQLANQCCKASGCNAKPFRFNDDIL
uniref:Uncharacterized protein n=1 Tax=Glossina austeni TaxID=7395 RepID=A0A1A9V5W2_GLOAU